LPELPDLTVYQEQLAARIAKRRLLRVRLLNPFLLRTALPPLAAVEGKKVEKIERLGKRIVIGLEGELYLVLHLMVAGRLRWETKSARSSTLAVFEFENGALALTEAGTKRRASLHLLQGKAALDAIDPGGLEVLDSTLEEFASRLAAENHTLKRALTDPRLFAGIGNAYSDEILHRAKLSPVAMTQTLGEEQVARLHGATKEVLVEWTQRLRSQAGDAFPGKVTLAYGDFLARPGTPAPAR
jgi:formamidopyrimidine-DNA glycosylase